MPSTFITNQKALLSDLINNILPRTQAMYALVGYFYFSGFAELYEQLQDKQVKILIGMNAEKALFNKIKEFEIIQEVHQSRGQIRQNYLCSLVQLFNDTDYFDSEEKQQAFRLIMDKIKNGSLQIRKTEQPNHAKLYIFENAPEASEGGYYPGSVITGSSNLSLQGLTDRFEINVIFRDEHYQEAKALFDELWNNAIDIVSLNNFNEFEAEVVERIWINKLPKPFLMYVRVLDEYFAVQASNIRFPAEITNNNFLNLKYQTDAIQNALNIIEKHNGVIIADVVGLGKSIIASTIAHNLGLKTLIIAPPHLRDQWEDYRYTYEFNAQVFSTGAIDKALEASDNIEEQKLIIIDEAHKFRNELTRDYADLHKLCQGNKVILLTATPFNNRPQDIFSMIKLFQIPAKSTIQTIDNLSYQFRQLVIEYKDIVKSQREKKESPAEIRVRIQKLAKEIRELISPLLIRRSRIDLQEIEEYRTDLSLQHIELNKIDPPQLLDYDLGELTDLYCNTLERIAPQNGLSENGFIGARYQPTKYIIDQDKYKKEWEEEYGDANLVLQSQINLAKFMRRLLVRRFESSKYSFRLSLEKMIHSAELIKEWYYRLGIVPIFKKGSLPDIETLLSEGGIEDDIDIEDIDLDELLVNYKDKGLLTIPRADLEKDFILDVEKDIALLQDIHNKWFSQGIGFDPKAEELVKILRQWLREDPYRKIVIFTEFSDTADYLFEIIKDHFRVYKYSSKDANQTNKRRIRENFDAGLPASRQKNEFDILIATDAISEGFNLHRAGTIFNYDIPYNPTRVIQRVGRINRINKKVFEKLYIFNFFPTAAGEEETRIKQISTLKIDMIHALLGEDTQVLTDEEHLESFFIEQYQKQQAAQEERSWDIEYRNLLYQLKTHQPNIIQKARILPHRSRVRRSVQKAQSGIIIFGRKGDDYKFKLGHGNEDISLSAEAALELFEAEVGEQPANVSPDYEKTYQRLKAGLFERKTQVASDKGKKEALERVEVLIPTTIKHKDYLRDIAQVIRTLDSLPDYFLKKLRNLDLKNPDKAIDELKRELPESYLSVMIESAHKIDDSDEAIILSEEMI